MLALNVLLLGDQQSGRSSVGNALIGSQEFQTGSCFSGLPVTTEYQRLSRNFPKYFRRQGEESGLMLSVVDTPPLLPRPHNIYNLCPEGVHVVVLVLRADHSHANTRLKECVETLFGPEWSSHTLIVVTHADHLEEAGLQSSAFLTQASGWLRGLAEEAEGGVFFLDNSSDWPSIRGRPLRDQLLRLSARNHHQALTFRSCSDSNVEVNHC